MDLSDGAATVKTYDEDIAYITRNILSSLESLKDETLVNTKIPVSDNIEMFSDLLGAVFIFIVDEWDYPLSIHDKTDQVEGMLQGIAAIVW